MVTTKTKTHAGPPLGSRWAQMWAYMWAEQLVIFWYMLPKVTFELAWFSWGDLVYWLSDVLWVVSNPAWTWVV